ncbi:MAG: LacI family DNA-binding transcriptional regulator [Bacteroidota bacterium]
MEKSITIKEIAKLAGVSIGTVDRVIHNRGRVSQETSDRITHIAAEHNYSSNVNARKLRLNRNLRIGVMLPSNSAFWENHKNGMISELDQLDSMQLEFFMFEMNLDSMRNTLQGVFEANLDGLILAPVFEEGNALLLEKLETTSFPIVLIDSKIKGWNDYLSFIGSDNYQSGKTACHLLSLGLEELKTYIVYHSIADEQKGAINARVEGLKAMSLQWPNHQVEEVNLERNKITQEELADIINEQSRPTSIYIPHSSTFLLEKLLTQIDRDKTRVLGHDLISENAKMLESNLVDFLLYQAPIRQGSLAISTLYRNLILNKEIATDQPMPIEIISKHNMEFVKR